VPKQPPFDFMRTISHIFDATPEQAEKFLALRKAADEACKAQWEFTKELMDANTPENSRTMFREFTLSEDGKHFVALSYGIE
jgi:hypothetical protein